MFGKFTYLFYTLMFTLPLIFIMWLYYWPILKKAILPIFLMVAVFTIYGSVMMTVALHVKAWSYSSDRFLGIYIFGAVLEDILWWFVIFILEISCVIIMLKKTDNKESLLKRGNFS